MAESDLTFEQLMQQAQQGDATAYAALLRDTALMLRPYLRKWLGSGHDAEDVLQEILISLHKARHTYDGNRPYKPWILAIARFRVAEYWRRAYADRLRHPVDLAEIENKVAAPVTENGSAYEYLFESLKALPPKQADIIRLMHVDGYTAREAAARLGMKENAVKVAAHRAYKILRRKLEDI
ncbi:MAG: sigma-70 family RNA polymerase sigma factor [Alphaproteobacteria bacterium]|nr:sigma-70 family RNA polymerase sigma factor [Alphaproteobacteria bacterium]